MSMLRLLAAISFLALVNDAVVPAAQAEGNGESFAEQFLKKRRKNPSVSRNSGSIFDFFRRPERREINVVFTKPRNTRVVSSKPRKKRFNNPSPELAQPNRLTEPLPSYGNLVYQPPKLEALRAQKLEGTPPVEPLALAVYTELADKNQGIRVTPAERKAAIAAYEANGFMPLWTTMDGLSPRGLALLAVFAVAGEDGLQPTDYLPAVLGDFDAAPETHRGDAQHLARLDLGLTAAALAYARHASGGRIEPNSLTSYNDITPQTVDPVLAMRVLSYSPFADAYLKSLQPRHFAYGAFRSALANLRAAWDEASNDPVPSGKRINPGKSDPRVALVRKRLERMGYYQPEKEPEFPAEGLERLSEPPPAADPERLDDTLAASIKAFQKKSNLKQTGAIDTLTVKALNKNTAKQDIERLVLNMDRLRWLPKDLGTRHVFVNQAAFKLEVIDHGLVVWRTNVVVGKRDTQTVAFHDRMEVVVFNPSWGIPQSIMTNEMLPILRRDPTYLDRKGFEVIDKHGKRVKSASVRWSSYGDKVPYTFHQPPGGDNALGEIKFLFPNAHDIYMHDTPSRALFQRPVRAFSHGCVRVQDPRRFAEVVAGISQEEIASRIDSGKSQSLRLKQKLPVHITYFTAWPAENGRIEFFEDIYGRDEHMEQALTVKTVAQR